MKLPIYLVTYDTGCEVDRCGPWFFDYHPTELEMKALIPEWNERYPRVDRVKHFQVIEITEGMVKTKVS
jgi:hypothetical protein